MDLSKVWRAGFRKTKIGSESTAVTEYILKLESISERETGVA
jgi:hypothetical protein